MKKNLNQVGNCGVFLSMLMLAALSASCTGLAQKAAVAKPSNLQKITGLKTPESAVQAQDGKIYVSEINGFGKDGDGQITVIEHGKASVLVSGLDDPKGLAIIDQTLYIADKIKVLKVALNATPKVETFVEARAFASTPQFLNDLETDPQGNLYVSDSGDILGTGKGGAIYKIDTTGKTQLLIDGKQDERVMAPNGLLVDSTGNLLRYVDFTSGVLYQYNQQTKTLVEVAQGFGGGDGLVHHSNGTTYVSDWKSGKVFSVNTKNEVSELKSGYQSAADIAITKDEQYLMVPDMKAGELDFIAIQ